MSDKEDYNFNKYLSEAQKKVKEFMLEREQLNLKLKDYILSFQSYDSEIYNSFLEARDFYTEKRYKYNLKLEELRRKKKEYERLWSFLTEKLETLPKLEINGNISTSVEYTKRSLEVIEGNIEKLTNILDEQILDIDEENEIIEKLRELESNKEEKLNILSGLKQKQVIKLQSSEYYIIQNKKETIEKDLTEIYNNLIKLSNKRLLTHKKMFVLYRKVREFENIKKEIENQLIENKTNADEYQLLFSKLLNLNKKVLLEELANKEKSKIRPRKIPQSSVKAIIKKKRKLKRMEQKKLEIALNKQKAGKKLDFYELQLILKHSKN
ncbi:MAG: hypothetical protein ACFE9S_17815 [Candidatus Hermodarchaeota archaeon]